MRCDVGMVSLARALLVLLLLSACRGKPAPPPDIGKGLMPKGATMVVVGRTDDNPNKWERSFTVPAAYPALGLTDESFALLRKEGWKRCTGLKDEWGNYVDKRPGAQATVYQRRQQWVRSNEVLQVMFSHRVDATGAGLLSQRVTLTFHGAQSPEEMARWKNPEAYGPCEG